MATLQIQTVEKWEEYNLTLGKYLLKITVPGA